MFSMLEKLDIFGVPLKLKTVKQEESFKTIYSGIVTLIIMASSLVYFGYVIWLWVSGQILPKVMISQSMIDYSVYEWENNVIQFSLFDVTTQINPFTLKDNIIMPVLLEISGVYMTALPKILFSSQQLDDGHQSLIIVDKGKLVLSAVDDSRPNDEEQIKQYMIFFTRCRSDWMPEGGNCADSQTIDDYLSTDHGLLFLSVKLQQYNFRTQNFDEIQKTQFFAFEVASRLYSQVILQQQKTVIDSGVLLSNLQQYNSLKDYQINNQQVTEQFTKNIIRAKDGSEFSFTSYCTFLFRLDNIQTYEMIVKPKLGEVLAQIGSIVNLIMLLKIVANMINVNLLENSTLHQIIEIYYPEMKQVQINSNIFGRVKSVHYKGQSIKTIGFEQQYNQLREIAKKKLSFHNLIYEMQKMQLVLIDKFGIETIKNIQYPLQELKFSNTEFLNHRHSQDNPAAIGPEESPRVEFERFQLFNYDN